VQTPASKTTTEAFQAMMYDGVGGAFHHAAADGPALGAERSYCICFCRVRK